MRGVHVHGESVARAQAGQRVALAFTAERRHTVARGDVVVAAGAYPVSYRLDVRIDGEAAGAVTVSAISTSGSGVSQSGLVTAKSAAITGTTNSSSGTAVTLGAVTLVAGGGNLVVTGNNANQTGTGITQTGAITDNVVGGNITFRSNNNISQNGAIALAKNTSGADSSVTYDLARGNRTSTLVAGNLTVAAGSTSGIDYNVYTSGSNLNPGTISVPGVITLDNPRKRNALSRAMMEAIPQAFATLTEQKVRVVIIRALPDVKVWPEAAKTAVKHRVRRAVQVFIG